MLRIFFLSALATGSLPSSCRSVELLSPPSSSSLSCWSPLLGREVPFCPEASFSSPPLLLFMFSQLESELCYERETHDLLRQLFAKLLRQSDLASIISLATNKYILTFTSVLTRLTDITRQTKCFQKEAWVNNNKKLLVSRQSKRRRKSRTTTHFVKGASFVIANINRC